MLVCIDRQIGEPKFYFFDENWQLKRHNKRGKDAPADFTLPRPQNLDEMFKIARLLSKGIPHLRVDLYNVDGKIYFAFSNNEFKLFYQPQYDVKSKKIIGFEALIRWANPKYIGESPLKFIEMAEK